VITHFFQLDRYTKKRIHDLPVLFGYGLFGQVIYYDHYSRVINGVKETWPDTVIRIIEGIFSIRKDWYIKTGVRWDEGHMQYLAAEMAIALQKLKWSPAGRGVWAMGTSLIYDRGAMPLYNCAYTDLHHVEDVCWMMDALMNGVGVSGGLNEPLVVQMGPKDVYYYRVPDCREGWVHSVRLLLQHYLERRVLPHFDYSALRGPGMPLKTFGGTSSGPGPLIKLHDRIHDLFANECATWADLANIVGCCVVAGNIRRSAEMLIGPLDDEFINLKDYDINGYRSDWGWMSNNTVRLRESSDFESINLAFETSGEIPGFVNLKNLPKGRLRDEQCVPDSAVGLNPCGEIPLENREVCNVAETYPTRCLDVGDWLMACKYACFYASTVTLLPTQQPSTNAVVVRNRRIGVGIVDYNTWRNWLGQPQTIRALRSGYNIIKMWNQKYAAEAGIPASLRLTTIKPGGTMPKLAGCIGGIGYNESPFILRRKRVQEGSELEGRLRAAGVPCEKDYYSDNTVVFEFPVYTGEEYNPGLWEQAMNLVTVQREWADNAVSNTLTYTDDDDLVNVVGNILPMVKSLSLLKRSSGGYPQMPEEPITKHQYEKRRAAIGKIDFTGYGNDATEADRFCSGDKCNV